MASLSYPKVISFVFTLSLLALCVLCYVLLVVLFVRPQAFHIDSLVHPDSNSIKPAVVVGLVAALLGGSTSALVTRAVEQSLWLKLAPRSVKNRLTVGESRRLAQWSVSPLARLAYVLNGSYWLLKIGGILLLASSIINAVLLAGISQTQEGTTSIRRQPREGWLFLGWLDESNSAYNGGNFRDVPGTVAALASLSKQLPPAAPLCNDTQQICSVEAVAGSIKATCKGKTFENPQDIGSYSSSGVESQSFCSEVTPKICVDLTSGSPYTYANFSGGLAPDCENAQSPCPAGSFASLFGVYASNHSQAGHHYLNSVECVITFGAVKITQEGQNPPKLVPDTYIRSSNHTYIKGSDFDHVQSDIVSLRRIYTQDDSARKISPFSFEAGAVGTGANTIFNYPVATLLLGTDSRSPAATVAKQIEKCFEMATLMAFGRSPNSSALTFRIRDEKPIYVYDPKVLLILLIPILATILGLIGRCHLAIDGDLVPGYDPVEIARRGPVAGLSPSNPDEDPAQKEVIDRFEIWGHQWYENYNGASVRRTGLVSSGTMPEHIGMLAQK